MSGWGSGEVGVASSAGNYPQSRAFPEIPHSEVNAWFSSTPSRHVDLDLDGRKPGASESTRETRGLRGSGSDVTVTDLAGDLNCEKG